MTSLHACLGCSRLAKIRRAVVGIPVATSASSTLVSSHRILPTSRVFPRTCHPYFVCTAPSDARGCAHTQLRAVLCGSRRSYAFFMRTGRLSGSCCKIFGVMNTSVAAINTLLQTMGWANGGTCGAPICVVVDRALSVRAVAIIAATVLHRVAAIVVFLSMCSMLTKQML